ncbi:unnamed protein product [Paramecium sonneborni]|uniref:Uncharacterized protein n=1 Tax=Paramecium sonneborni TaxID=65129 RepID=A0A8S1MXP5_9CILI|nr:unnamed protein product [Paramecium sonneborni]
MNFERQYFKAPKNTIYKFILSNSKKQSYTHHQSNNSNIQHFLYVKLQCSRIQNKLFCSK